MARRVGILSAERRSERIDVTERLRERLALQLAGYREIRLRAEEILAVVDGAVFIFRKMLKVERCDLEHFAGALCVRCRDERRVDVDKAVLLEELVDRVGNQRADAEGRLECICARAEMRHRAQILERVALFLQRVVRAGRSLDVHLIGLNLKRLLRLRRRDQCSADDDCGADIEMCDLAEIAHPVVENDLKRIEIRAVMNDHESECLRIADRADPAADRDLLVQVLLPVLIDISYCNKLLHFDALLAAILTSRNSNYSAPQTRDASRPSLC